MEKMPRRWWDFYSAFLLLVVVWIVALRLTKTDWVPQLDRVHFLALIAVSLGLALGASRFPGWAAGLMAAFYSVIAVPWQLGNAIGLNIEWSEKLNSLYGRLYYSVLTVIHKQPLKDPILFLSIMAVLFWIISLIAGYLLTRKGNAWVSVLLLGVALVVIHHYSAMQSFSYEYIIAFIFCALLLIGRNTFINYRNEWKSQNLSMNPEAGSDVGWATLIAVFVMILLVVRTPLPQNYDKANQVWKKVSEPWNEFKKNFNDALAAVKSPPIPVVNPYPDSMALGTGTRLGDEQIFMVRAAIFPPGGNHYYWEARTYNTYANGSWKSKISYAKNLNPGNVNIDYPTWKERVNVLFRFTINPEEMTVLYLPTNPTWISRPVQAMMSVAADGVETPVYFQANPILHAGDEYGSQGLIAAPTVNELRQASRAYPAWVKEGYLGIPDGFPSTIKDLAEYITREQKNPYDKAQAITNYLRANITYSTSITPPPAGREPLEWFLFEYKKGYCNYYASAEVMMLRTLGIPARLAVGYAEGEYEEQNASYIVKAKDSHAWPEVYFPDYGWIEFEPTSSITPIDRPLDGPANPQDLSAGIGINLPTPLAAPTPSVLANSGGNIDRNAALIRTLVGMIYILAIAGVIALFFLVRKWANGLALPVALQRTLEKRGIRTPRWFRAWVKRYPPTQLEAAFAQVNKVLRWLGEPVNVWQTASEKVDHLCILLPEIAGPARMLLREYHSGSYSPYPYNIENALLAGTIIRRVGRIAWLRKSLRLEPSRQTNP